MIRTSIVLLILAMVVMGRESVALKCNGGDGSSILGGKILDALFEVGEDLGLDLIEREQMDALLEEQMFQQTGCTDVSCAVEMGKILNVQKMLMFESFLVRGARRDSLYAIPMRLVDVGTSRILSSTTLKCYIDRTGLPRCRVNFRYGLKQLFEDSRKPRRQPVVKVVPAPATKTWAPVSRPVIRRGNKDGDKIGRILGWLGVSVGLSLLGGGVASAMSE